ncbi:hypothetical protein AURDEDRAFT_140707, partial [Auricularia subglabra TFB-10046 SS5]
MSSLPVDPATVIFLEDLRSWKFAHLSSFMVLIVDWIICLPVEIDYVWSRKRSLFTVLWCSIRYIPILLYTMSIYTTFQSTWTQEVCSRTGASATIFLAIALACSHAIFMMRTWALYGRSRMPLIVLGPLLLLSAALHLLTIHDAIKVDVPEGMGCIPASPSKRMGIVAWSATLTFDSVAFALTLKKTLKYAREQVEAGVLKVFLRDGVIYYAAMFLCYLVDIILFAVARESLRDLNASFSATFTVTLTTRLLLNLRSTIEGPRSVFSVTTMPTLPVQLPPRKSNAPSSTRVNNSREGNDRQQLDTLAYEENERYDLDGRRKSRADEDTLIRLRDMRDKSQG